MPWRQIVLRLGDLDAGAVEALFERHGAQAVTLSDAADDPVLEPLPGETPLWRETSLTGLFDVDFDSAALLEALRDRFGLAKPPEISIETLEDRAWEREWLRDFKATRFGNGLWVCPVDAPSPDDSAAVIRLDPGLAFGTGTHPTTALCLEQIDKIDVSGMRVLDFGCGSGILAIGALLLGAGSAMAFDIDNQAIIASKSNAAQNGVADRLQATADAAELGRGYSLVLANILAGPLMELAAELSNRLAPGGTLLLSGILSEQARSVMQSYECWIEFEPPSERDGWVCLRGTRTAG